jgi:hypothetical protein
MDLLSLTTKGFISGSGEENIFELPINAICNNLYNLNAIVDSNYYLNGIVEIIHNFEGD